MYRTIVLIEFIIGRPPRFIHIFNYVNEIKAAQLKGSRAPLLVESLINLLKALCARENDVKGGHQRLPVTKIITGIMHGRCRISAIICMYIDSSNYQKISIQYEIIQIEK